MVKNRDGAFVKQPFGFSKVFPALRLKLGSAIAQPICKQLCGTVNRPFQLPASRVTLLKFYKFTYLTHLDFRVFGAATICKGRFQTIPIRLKCSQMEV
ncbi:MAG: hypothetical protein DCF25_21080 [Leptolyngbya foveolarum]|uniref:Uncharacterized protein n=1 Tax=Leptolyngbya foveolarum TaxID=47253 RepID=A0A2W4VSS1_9CYAN|nr:MAG: hypothetical protein DCF25_21080 [Leptolyngbya foveolarum]